MGIQSAGKTTSERFYITLSPGDLSKAGIEPQSLVGCRYQAPTVQAEESVIAEVDAGGGLEVSVYIDSSHEQTVNTVSLDSGNTSAIVKSDSLDEVISFTNAALVTYGGL